MSRKFFVGALILLLSVTIFSAAAAKRIEGVWRLDGSASDEPLNFRFMTDDWQNPCHGKEPTRAGLNELWISASGQPSEHALSILREKILEREPDAKIIIVDLRQESHGFVNSTPVSWWIKNNAANAGKTTADVLKTEENLLKNLRGVETTFEPLGNADKKRLKSVTITPHFVKTEREVCESLGLGYERFAAADMQFPAPELVDEFITFVAMLPEKSWLHFHCQAGHGRTTTFMVMYEIMKNPDVSLEEICKRQYLLGGSNLLLEPEGNVFYATAARDRAKKIRLFYEFVQGTRAEKIGLQWSEWLTEVSK